MKELKNYFFLIISILTISILFLLFTKPKIEDIQKQAQVLKSEKDKLVILSNKAEVLSGLDDVKLTDWVKKVNFVLPSEKSVEGLMFTLDRLSQEASVSVSSLAFTPGLVTKKGTAGNTVANKILSVKGQDSFDVTLTVDGKIPHLKIFFLKLKEMLLATKIKKLNISQPIIKGDNLATADLVMEIYHKPASLTLGEISEPVVFLTKVEQKLLSEIQNIKLPEETIPFIIPRLPNSDPFFGE